MDGSGERRRLIDAVLGEAGKDAEQQLGGKTWLDPLVSNDPEVDFSSPVERWRELTLKTRVWPWKVVLVGLALMSSLAMGIFVFANYDELLVGSPPGKLPIHLQAISRYDKAAPSAGCPGSRN